MGCETDYPCRRASCSCSQVAQGSVAQSLGAQYHSAQRSADGSIKCTCGEAAFRSHRWRTASEARICGFHAANGEPAEMAPSVFLFRASVRKVTRTSSSGFTAVKQLCAVARAIHAGLTVHCSRESLNSLRRKNPRRISRLGAPESCPRDKSEIKSRCTAATDTRAESRRAAQPMSHALP